MTSPITTISRSWVTKDGSSGLKAEAGRYHLYVALICPFAQRTLIVRELKGLKSAISCTVVKPLMSKTEGWQFAEPGELEGCDPDPNVGAKTLREIYQLTAPGYAGKVTVPVLFDKVTKKIVNNESAEIVQMLNSEFNEFGETEEQRQLDLFPEELKTEIEQANALSDELGANLFKAATTKQQEEFDQAFDRVFAILDSIEEILSKNQYIACSQLTLADVRLFVNLIRFDVAYYPAAHINLKRVQDYPKMFAYLKELYNRPEWKATVNFQQIKEVFYKGIKNESVVPKGPIINL